MGEDSFENHQSILSDCFTVEFSKDTTSQQVDIHKLTNFFKSLITNKEDILSIKGITNFTKFWRNNDSTQLIDFNLSFWKSVLEIFQINPFQNLLETLITDFYIVFIFLLQ